MISSSNKSPVKASITSKLHSNFEPTHLEVINESHMHNVPKNAETHFKIILSSTKFQNKTLLQRQRMVNSILSEEMSAEGPIHALSMVCKTPEQWEKILLEGNGNHFTPSPKCLGGDGTFSK